MKRYLRYFRLAPTQSHKKLGMGIRILATSVLLFSCAAMSASTTHVTKITVEPQPAPAVPISTTTTSVVTQTAPQPIELGNVSPKPSKSPTPTFLWNLQDADILSVINEVAQETGKNFVVDPRVTGKITLISSQPIKQYETYQVFLSILELLGYSAIPNGKVIKIVPNMESAEMATKVANSLNPGKGDEVVVRVIPLRNVSATQLIPVLRPLLPQWSNVSAYSPGNVLILLGRAGNLQRIMDIIQDVDRASSTNIEIVSLHHASAPSNSLVSQFAQYLNLEFLQP